MTLPDPAPYHDDLAGGRPLADARWVRTSDGVRIRIAAWRPEEVEPLGTVLLLPGRTEHVEKYHDVAGEFAAAGFSTLAIDWRGQGLSDRLISDEDVGHVIRITDYQQDLAAALQAAEALDLPRPWHMLGHSMGGGIGLRALMEGVDVATCAFTGPMWGIYFSPLVKPFSRALPAFLVKLGMGEKLAPSTKRAHYVLTAPFKGNVLTKDPDQYEKMRSQLTTHPQLAIGGPTNRWLIEALRETDGLAKKPSPDVSCLCILGADEAIIDCDAVHDRMARWPNGRLEIINQAEHEVMMEVDATRRQVIDMLIAHFHQQPEDLQPAA